MTNTNALQGTMLIVKTTQNLINDGWRFTVKSDDSIEYAQHDDYDSVFFGSPTELKNWLYEKAEEY